MKRKLFLTAWIALLLSVQVNAQLLWKISGNGLTKPSYLFGTHHLIEKEQIKNFDQTLQLCLAADAVVGEVDMSDPQTMQLKVMQGALMKDTTCKELMNAEDYTLLDNEFKQLLGVGLDQLGALKPMMLSTMFSIMMYLKSKGIAGEPEAIDALFQKEARANNKKIIGIETVEDQINALFNTVPLRRQAEMLVKCVKEKEKELKLFDKLNEAYLSGDFKKMEEVNREDDSMTDAEKKPLIENRNNNWMKKLPEQMKEQSCFIAVGFGHLVEETGLVNQLEKAGYRVEAVKF